MAASSGDGIPAQLAALLGHPTKPIWIPDETPPRISAIDVATAMTSKHVRNAARNVLFVQEEPPEVFFSKSEPLPLSWPSSAKHTRDVRYWPHKRLADAREERNTARGEFFFFGIRPSGRRRAVKERRRRSVERAPQAPAAQIGAMRRKARKN